MSFGYSIGDGIALMQLAYKVFEGARKACGEHDDLTREVGSLHKVLQRLRKELASPDSLLDQADDDRRHELDEHGKGVETLLKVMDDVITKYNLLSSKDGKKAAQRLWQKVKFGNGELKNLADIRLKFATYTSAMSLNLCSLGSQGRVEKELRNVSTELGGSLEGITTKLDWIAANITARNGDGTTWTNYDNDDRSFWRQLRRDLINEGYHSKALVKHKELLKNYVAELGQRGAFDEMSSGEDTDLDDERHSENSSTRVSEDNEAWGRDDELDQFRVLGGLGLLHRGGTSVGVESPHRHSTSKSIETIAFEVLWSKAARVTMHPSKAKVIVSNDSEASISNKFEKVVLVDNIISDNEQADPNDCSPAITIEEEGQCTTQRSEAGRRRLLDPRNFQLPPNTNKAVLSLPNSTQEISLEAQYSTFVERSRRKLRNLCVPLGINSQGALISDHDIESISACL